jgi:rhodanese-related sulfurtransferase
MHCRFLFLLLVILNSLAAEKMTQDSLESLLNNGTHFDFFLFDFRGESEILSAIGNSQCKSYNFAWPKVLIENSKTLNKDAAIILYCASGNRAGFAADSMDKIGFKRIYNAGGMSNWNGSTITKAEMLPASSLPEPSMKATVSVKNSYLIGSNKKNAGNKLVVSARSQQRNILEGSGVFNIQGQKVTNRLTISEPYKPLMIRK